MTVVSITDEMTQRALARQLGPIGAARIYGELVERQRAERQQEGLTRSSATLEPPPVTPSRTKPVREPTSPESDRLRVEFRPHVQRRFTVHLGHRGVEAIRSELDWGASDNVEVGGFLWSHTRAREGVVVVAHVSPPAHDSQHAYDAVRLGRPSRVKANMPAWLRRTGLLPIGDFHSHPTGDGTPSDSDLQAWAGRVEENDRQPWLALIATRGEPGAGWAEPRLTAWATFPACPWSLDDVRTGFICEPAKLIQPQTAHRP
jgi:proteasome lid subunit RPN8/RPN11